MKSETDLLKAAEKSGGGFVWGLIILVFLFSVLLAGGKPASERSTPPATPAGRQQAARPEHPVSLVETAVSLTPVPTHQPRPTSRPQQPAAAPTWTLQPTYTPLPTWTVPPTAVPSQTPLPTYTLPATQTALPTYTLMWTVTATVPIEMTRPPLAAVVAPTPPPPGGAGINMVGLVVSAVALSVVLVVFIFTISRPIVVHVAPQRMILPPPTGQPIRAVAPVQNTGVTSDTGVFAPVQEGDAPPAGRITLAVKPTDSDADMALIEELWTIYQSLPDGRKTANEVCAAKWGRGKDGQIKKNPGRMVLVNRAIQWGKEREARLRNQPQQRPLIANKGQVEA